MSEFELLAIPLSLVLGLGITQILGGITSAVRQRRAVRLHWVPLTWAVMIFAFQVLYFFVLWDINEGLVRTGASWTWAVFGPAFFHASLFFLAAGLILPGRRDGADTLFEDFRSHGRLALVPLLVAHLAAIPLNVYQHGVPVLDQSNVLNAMLAVATVAVLVPGGVTRWRWATVLHALVQLYGLAGPWSKPGAA